MREVSKLEVTFGSKLESTGRVLLLIAMLLCCAWTCNTGNEKRFCWGGDLVSLYELVIRCLPSRVAVYPVHLSNFRQSTATNKQLVGDVISGCLCDVGIT